ncbi:MAG: L-histidine N(alpha)-methyltransferase [Labilithrix sp.]|nr:L-histidine N(alpha)-methyltransferase [Labilithrix sp.]MCW5810160.1 L-histidine N(alpha)-methyltransferase [Labilithrix sp.]
MTPLDGTSSCSAPAAERNPFLADALAGLRARPKRLSPKYFYDLEGSRLFDAICDLPEYYVTRTETAILEQRAAEIADRLGPCRIVEPGAGSGTKTRILLAALGPDRCREYVPVDIDGEHLAHAAAQHRAALPWLRVSPYAADITTALPSRSEEGTRTVVFFPGSTIGNFDPPEAEQLLRRFRRAAGADGRVVVGFDLKKDPSVLHAAYNDARGVTAAFNRNVLRRMNDELGADFDLAAFHHYAFYAPVPGRIEMHLVSARAQEVRLGEHVIAFEDGESICTEHSYKYDLAGAERLARAAGLRLEGRWLDADRRFAVLSFAPADNVVS